MSVVGCDRELARLKIRVHVWEMKICAKMEWFRRTGNLCKTLLGLSTLRIEFALRLRHAGSPGLNDHNQDKNLCC